MSHAEWSRPRSLLGLQSLQGKFLWGAVLLIFVVMTSVLVVVDHRQRSAIIDEVQRRGEALSRNFAAISYGPLLFYNFTALEQNVARMAAEEDVVYAIVLDAEGRVAAYSGRPDRVGALLQGQVHARAARTDVALIQETEMYSPREPIYDFAVPIRVNGQKWGTVRVGVSKRRMESEIRQTRLELGALTVVTLLLGGFAAALVARRIARPIRQLADGAAAISRGDFNQRIDTIASDEIGQLAITFNHMATQLLQQRNDLEQAHGELRRQFEELADVKSYTDNILRSLTSGIVTVDLDGRVVTLNPAAELLTGFFAGEVIGRYCTEVFAHSGEVGEALMETLANSTGIVGLPLMLRRRNGHAVPVELTTAPLRGGEGKGLGVVGVFRDVTVVQELEGQLRRADRLAALGTLAAGLAHEIKNPLTSLLTFTRHLGRKFQDQQFRDRFQRVVPRELERINSIVDRLLDLARPVRLSFEPVRVPRVLERVLELYDNQISSKAIRVVREYARDLPAIEADPEYLYRVFVNLVANALDAMSPGGRLGLRAGWSDGGATRFSARRSSQRFIDVEVEDDGIGIPDAERDRIFNPFFTTKETGTGLGLALSYKIVDEHGGMVDFRSEAGAGTTFRVTLPVRRVPGPLSGSARGAGIPADPAGRRSPSS